MSGYLFFKETGNQWVDHILNTIKSAGDEFHHTECWADSDGGDDVSHIGLIQGAADVAARYITQLEKENTKLKELVEEAKEYILGLNEDGNLTDLAEYSGLTWLKKYKAFKGEK